MAIQAIDNYDYRGRKPNFERDSFKRLADLKSFPETEVDEGHISFCEETGEHYEFRKDNSIDPTTGRWRKYKEVIDALDSKDKSKSLSANQGRLLNEKDKELKGLIDAKVIEAGGVSFDLEPTPDSSNPVTSGGIYKETSKLKDTVYIDRDAPTLDPLPQPSATTADFASKGLQDWDGNDLRRASYISGVLDYEDFREDKSYSAGDTIVYSNRLYEFASPHKGPWSGTDVVLSTLNKKISKIGLQVNGITKIEIIHGAGDNAIRIDITGLSIGKQYIIRAKDWSYNNEDYFKFQLAYYDDKSNVVASFNGGSIYRDVEFTAMQSNYFSIVRVDKGLSVEFEIILKEAITEDLKIVKTQVVDIDKSLNGHIFVQKSIIGNGDNVVNGKINGLVAGQTYAIDAKDWIYNNSDKIKFTCSYYDNKSNNIYQIYGGEKFCRFSFVAEQDTYLFALRAEKSSEIRISVYAEPGIKDKVTTLEEEIIRFKEDILYPTDSYELNKYINEIYIGPSASFAVKDVTSIQYNTIVDGRHQIFFFNKETRLAATTLSETPIGVQRIAEGVYVSIRNLLDSRDMIRVNCSLKNVCGNVSANPSIYSYLQDLKTNHELLGELVNKTKSLSGWFINKNGQIQQNQYFTTDIYDMSNIDSSLKIETSTSNAAMALYAIRKDDIIIKIGDTTDITRVAYIEAQEGDTLYVSYANSDGATLVNKYYIPLRKDISNIKKNVYNLNVKIDNPQPNSKWKGKNIVWYGTSIPAGDSRNVSYNGFSTKVLLSYTDTIVEYDGHLIANQYPAMVGSLQNSYVFNESLGSSTAAATTKGDKLLLRCKGMGNRVSDICSWLLDCYIIDWDNKTFKTNVNNSIGVTQFLSASTWDELMQQFYNCIRISYEIAIISRYCIKDDIEHQEWILNIFGDYYSIMKNGLASAGLDLDYMCAYKCDVDLFVFDHGHNDYYFNVNWDSVDRTNFKGAYNEFFRSILRYNPIAKIVIVSDYTNYNPQFGTIESQQEMASRWQFPFINVSKIMPLQKNTKVLSEGYWDEYGFWHNNGFIWEENLSDNTYSTNATFNSYIKSNSLSEMKVNINPQQINGKWLWETYPLYLWLFDGLHPHSDREGRINKWYAEMLYRWLETI